MARAQNSPDQPSFGQTFSEMRRVLKLTQLAVAESIGVSGSAVSQYEASKRVPQESIFGRLTTIVKLVAAQKPPVIQMRALDKLGLLTQLYAPPRPGRRPGLRSVYVQCGRKTRESLSAHGTTACKQHHFAG